MQDYPEELRELPRPVIALLGAPSLHQPTIQNVTKTKSLAGTEIPSLHILSLDSLPPIFERKKEKRQSYDGYIPTGIFKAAWMHKHKNLLPGVLCYMILWDEEKNNKAKENEMYTELENIKKSLRSRSIKLLIVLVQRQSGADAGTDERLNIFRKRGDLDSKNIFFFDTQNLPDSAKRLEKVAGEMARTYYKEEARRIKKEYQKGNTSKLTQQILTVRHHFKIAYYAEFRRDSRTTLKYYTSSYNHLREMGMVEMKSSDKSKMTEIKTVADYINFQICKQYLTIANLAEAVNQFQKHVKTYKMAVGQTELEFDHWAWMSRQYQVFAQLLEVLIPGILPNVSRHSMQHPGFYWQAAAKYAIERKKHVKRLTEPLRQSPILENYIKEGVDPPRPLASIDLSTQVYIGQIVNEDLAHPLALDQGGDAHAVVAVDTTSSDYLYKAYARELTVDHSQVIIDLLTRAYEQYKSPKSSRMILYVASQMAQEYYAAENYEVAKRFLDRIAKSYRKEEWWSVLTATLNTAMRCARQLGLVTDYVQYALELLTSFMCNTTEEKRAIQKSIVAVLANPTVTMSAPALQAPIIIPLYYNHPLLSAKVQFPQAQVYAQSPLTFLVRIKPNFPLPVKFNKLRVEFSDPAYNTEVTTTQPTSATPASTTDTNSTTSNNNNNKCDLVSTNGEVLCSCDHPLNFSGEDPAAQLFTFNFTSKEKMELRCTSLLLEFGSTFPSCVQFIWTVTDWPVFQQVQEGKTAFTERTVTTILAHRSKVEMTLSHVPPALANEFYKMEIHLKNGGEPIKSGELNLMAIPPGEDCFFKSEDRTQPLRELSVPAIATGGTHTVTVFFFCSNVAHKKVVLKASYDTAVYSSSIEKMLDILVQLPFTPHFNFFSPQFHPLAPSSGSIVVNQPFFLYMDIQSTTPYQLVLHDSKLLLNKAADQDGSVAVCEGTSHMNSRVYVLSRENKFTIWYKLLPNVSGDAVDLGSVQLQWKRSNDSGGATDGDGGVMAVASIPLPPLKISTAPFSVKIDVPPFGVVGSATPLTTQIQNHTHLLQEFQLTVTDNPSFLFCGDRQSTFSIQPHSSHVLRHTLLPLTAGRQPIPSFQLVSKRYNKELAQTKQTRYIFINPSKEPTRHIK